MPPVLRRPPSRGGREVRERVAGCRRLAERSSGRRRSAILERPSDPRGYSGSRAAASVGGARRGPPRCVSTLPGLRPAPPAALPPASGRPRGLPASRRDRARRTRLSWSRHPSQFPCVRCLRFGNDASTQDAGGTPGTLTPLLHATFEVDFGVSLANLGRGSSVILMVSFCFSFFLFHLSLL